LNLKLCFLMRQKEAPKAESAIFALIRLAIAGSSRMLGRARDPKAAARNVAAKSVAAKSVALKRPPTLGNLWRQAGWGLAAVAALFVAVLSGRDDGAMQRVGALLVSLDVLPAPPPKHQFDPESAARQLAQAVRGLAEDRDRLATRLAAIERDMGDMTGSIKKQIEAVKAAKSEPPPWPGDAPPVPMTPADIAAMITPVSPAAASPAPSQSTAASPPSAEPVTAAGPAPAEVPATAATAYGADIGTASTMKALQARWVGLRTAHPALFDGLQPLVNLKQNRRSNRTELHLVVGPYSNAEAAEQFCDFVMPFHLTCQPAMFDGSRLALQ
jgi:hypothetical protein